MKNLFLVSVLSATLFSCQKEGVAQAELNDYPQTWRLVKMTGQFPASVTTGSALPWQETLAFRADSTFTKTRKQGDQKAETTGTFSLRRNADRQSVILTYPSKQELVNNCVASPKETLIFNADTLVSSALACDGPRLEYKLAQ
ncbi:hypothetical protein HMJ29_18345 [Hymenobacter taeanensis]|uniref:Lipocalin family protein n=1 Tax=Hymenobacter taeanensis TaxID=2735321 RepID=A0A6M6BLE8_9BACT|nr:MULTISPECIES: hypothetical protein [Hymenobacter]QJX48770.1 hypothetical protein HMJ29_18345 [Hymenobacter taeanensis]UOQ81725.1 hypothetical protein MUN83_02730 [Hymenobacter sp. 5414T-23]